MMKVAMDGKLPKAIELAGDAFPEMVAEHAYSSAFALAWFRSSLSYPDFYLISYYKNK